MIKSNAEYNLYESNNYFAITSYQSNNKIEIEKPKAKKFKRYENIKCVVCGDVSSGFHYGAYTCEACKLFFIRTARQNRSLNPCQSGNCYVDVEKRKSCASCRYKNCIASGMSLSRRKFGRHTEETYENERDHIPNISNSLIQAYQQLYTSFQEFLQNDPNNVDNEHRNIFTSFYYQCLNLLNVNTNTQKSQNELIVEKNEEFDLTEFFDTTMLVIFYVIFEFDLNDVSFDNDLYNRFAKDLIGIIQNIKYCLRGNDFSFKLKILCFVFLLHSIEQLSLSVFLNLRDDICKRRLDDLIKSEFSMCKFDVKNNNAKNAILSTSEFVFTEFCLTLSEVEILIVEYKYLYIKELNFASKINFLISNFDD